MYMVSVVAVRGCFGSDYSDIVLGFDYSDIVESIGPKVTNFKVRDPVCELRSYQICTVGCRTSSHGSIVMVGS
ncbi:hypothetical protein L1887_03078 [Cichorium endivia]|nr:hypothetical protein L1887_03078 [Cichorium endivia]